MRPSKKQRKAAASAPLPSSGGEPVDVSAREEQIRSEHGFGHQTFSYRNILPTYFFVHPQLISLLHILCRIYHEHPSACPIEVVLIVFTYQFIEFEMDFKNEDQIERFIQYIRSRWKTVGPYINSESSLSCVSPFLRMNLSRQKCHTQWAMCPRANRSTFFSALPHLHACPLLEPTLSTMNIGAAIQSGS